jgi:hypothetical protein
LSTAAHLIATTAADTGTITGTDAGAGTIAGTETDAAVEFPRLRLPSTPSLLRIGMVLACLPVAAFALALQLGVDRNEGAVRTVGRDATQGINVAQDIKLNLAEMDALVAQDLLADAELTESGFPEDYNLERIELSDNLMLAASGLQGGDAYQQPLANIDYALGHYHTLVRDAFASMEDGNPGRAADRYARAHTVMNGTLLPEAEFVDKANSYVLNTAYDLQQDRSARTARLIVFTWVVLLVFLVVVQVLLTRKFRRVVNPALAVATLLTLAVGGVTLSRLDSSSAHLTLAREESFDSVHELARARATVVAARQTEGQLLLDRDRAADARTDFQTQVAKLFRVDGRDDIASLAQAGAVPDGAAGYLATVAVTDGEASEGADGAASRQTIVALGDFLVEDARIRDLVDEGDETSMATAQGAYESARTYQVLTSSIDAAQAANQSTFDTHASAALDDIAYLGRITVAVVAGVLGLVLLGLYLRLREYAT